MGNDGKREDQLQRIVEQGLCTKPSVPACHLVVLRVDCEGHTTDFRRHLQRPITRRKEKVAAEPLPLRLSIDGQSPQTEDRHVVATEISGQAGWDAGEFDRPGTDCVEPQYANRFRRGSGDKGLRTPGLVIPTRVTPEVLVKSGVTAVERPAVMVPADRFFPPVEQQGYARSARRRAAASNAGVGSGGFSSSSSTRSVSRSDRTIRSDRSTTSLAAGSALRRMKLVTSSLSRAAAAVRRRFSSLVARNSIRSMRLTAVLVGMRVNIVWN